MPQMNVLVPQKKRAFKVFISHSEINRKYLFFIVPHWGHFSATANIEYISEQNKEYKIFLQISEQLL